MGLEEHVVAESIGGYKCIALVVWTLVDEIETQEAAKLAKAGAG